MGNTISKNYVINVVKEHEGEEVADMIREELSEYPMTFSLGVDYGIISRIKFFLGFGNTDIFLIADEDTFTELRTTTAIASQLLHATGGHAYNLTPT